MNFVKQNRLVISLFLFLALFLLSWPFYIYIFDVDGIGYAAVAHHYIKGDWEKAVNGFWNPLHSWLVIPFIKAGLADGAAFKTSNAIIALASLVSLHYLLQKFTLTEGLKTCIQLCSVILLLHYAYYELAADVLFVLLMLLYFNLYFSEKFYTSNTKNFLAGLLGAALYLCKSYGFPFFIFHFTVIHLFLNSDKRRALIPYITGLTIFLACSFLWMMALYWKYGEWMIAFGKYNAHWDFTGDIQPGPLLQPPPYEGSAAAWEDPWHVRNDNFQQVPVYKIVLQQVRAAVYNAQQLLLKVHELSFFAPALLLLFFIKAVFNRSQKYLWLLLSVCTLPACYVLLHIETRFIWVLSFLIMIGGASLLQNWFTQVVFAPWQQRIIWTVYFCSFLLYPLDHLKDSAFAGKEFYDTAAAMKKNNISGSFTSTARKSETSVIAYLSGNPYYTRSKVSYSTKQMMDEIKQYRIKYYFFYYRTIQDKEAFLNGMIANEAVSIIELEKGLLVAEFSHIRENSTGK
jgi:hypothetical protein